MQRCQPVLSSLSNLLGWNTKRHLDTPTSLGQRKTLVICLLLTINCGKYTMCPQIPQQLRGPNTNHARPKNPAVTLVYIYNILKILLLDPIFTTETLQIFSSFATSPITSVYITTELSHRHILSQNTKLVQLLNNT